MASVVVQSPFGDEPVPEVPLSASPLVRVLSQIRFPRLASLVTGEDAALKFVDAMKADYPILTEQREVSVTITPEGVSQTAAGPRVWQLRSADETWQVSFGESFVALDTGAYISREHFATQMDSVWRCFVEVVAPPSIERIGVRYINRLADQEMIDDLSFLLRPEALGGANTVLPVGVRLSRSMHEALYEMGETDALQARWGVLPAGAVLDPTLRPVATSSWVLDVDSFRTGRIAVEPNEVGSDVRLLAARVHRYFRWMVTDEFLIRCGGVRS